MKRPLAVVCMLFWCSFNTVFAASADDQRTFTLLPTAPPVPALKYRLLTDPNDRHPGNAALPYMRAALLHSDSIERTTDQAMDAHDANNQAVFNKLAPQIAEDSGTFDLLQLAAQCDHCDWEPGIKERGTRALLPELNYLRADANRLSVRASYQLSQGKIEDCINTLRLIYEMGQNVGKAPVLIDGLVAAGLTNLADDRLIELMQQTGAPNLYWALSELPRPLQDIQPAIQVERTEVAVNLPLLNKARTQELSAAEWTQVMNQALQLSNENRTFGKSKATYDYTQDFKPGGTAAHALPAAQAHYASTHGLSADDVALMDSIVVVSVYYFDQYQQVRDIAERSATLPAPAMLAQLSQLSADAKKMRDESQGNPLLSFPSNFSRAAISIIQIDRQVSALMTIQAISAYTAQHGTLPEHLSDIADTPAPTDPSTGEAFEYQPEKDSAIISSHGLGEYPLQFKIHLRQGN